MTLEEWIKEYEKKTKRKFEPAKGFKLFYFPERGFCEIATNGNMVMAYQLCGDGKFWRRILEFLSISLGYKVAGTICIRHILPYIRFWGFSVVRTEELSDGTKRYFAEDGYGKRATFSPAWKFTDNGEYAYYVTWEV